MARSWIDHLSKNVYPNLKEASNKASIGWTAVIADKPYLAIDWDGKYHILENEEGQVIKSKLVSQAAPKTLSNSLLAASRVLPNPIPRGTLEYVLEDNTWRSRVGEIVVPVEDYIEALESVNWSRSKFDVLAHEEGEREDEKTDSLKCPKCSSHTCELTNPHGSEFHCLSCGNMFQHEVIFNPKSNVHTSDLGLEEPEFEVDQQLFEGPFAPPRQDENQRVLEWRQQQLIQSGVDPNIATQIAQNQRIDLHQAVQMIQQGATAEQVYQILSKKVAYEVDESSDWHHYAPGPDDPKKVHCSDCGYSWKSHHEFHVTGGKCPRCNKPMMQSEVQKLEDGDGWKNPKQHFHKSSEDWKQEYDYRDAVDSKFSCSTCGYYSNNNCNMFNASVESDYTCDEWDDNKKTATKLGWGQNWDGTDPMSPEEKAKRSQCHPWCDWIPGQGAVHHPDCPNYTLGSEKLDYADKILDKFNPGFMDKPGDTYLPQTWSHKNSIYLDKFGNPLKVGEPYLLHSPNYQIPDLVYIVKSEPHQVEAAIESGDELYPLTINEERWNKMLYSFEPFMSKTEFYEKKHSWDYNQTTDSMSGHDTGAPIRENPLDYGENVHNEGESASPVPLTPLGMPRHDENLDLHTPKGSVHRMQSSNGDEILVMSDGKGGAMGWAPYQGEMTHEGVKWDTSNLFKVQEGINNGHYRSMSKTARKKYSPTEQKELIDESMGATARNRNKLDLQNTHYELVNDENSYIWLW